MTGFLFLRRAPCQVQKNADPEAGFICDSGHVAHTDSEEGNLDRRGAEDGIDSCSQPTGYSLPDGDKSNQ